MAKLGYHHGDLEAALVKAALHEVESKGIATVTLRDLARTIGVSPSATYRHFPSRDHLVAALALEARQRLALALVEARDAVPATGPKASRSIRRLEAIGGAYVRFALRNPRLFELAFTRCPVPPPAAEEPSSWGVLVGVIDEMAATGAMPRAGRDEATLIAWSAVHGLSTILTAATVPSEPGLHHSTAEAMITTVIAGVVRSLR